MLYSFIFICIFTDDIAQTGSGSKRKLLATSDGRRHLYCMRSASVKSLNRSNNGNSNNAITMCGIAGHVGGVLCTSPTHSMTVINVPQQQRFQLHQHRQQQQQMLQHQSQESERRKSNSTPSLRITDAALRRYIEIIFAGV